MMVPGETVLSSENHECLKKTSWQTIKKFLRHFTQKHKYEPRGGAEGRSSLKSFR